MSHKTLNYTPTGPLKAVSKSVLSQDVITTATIPVDSVSRAALAVFTNSASGGESGSSHPEALAIVNTGKGRQLCHVARDSAADAGWRATALFGGQPCDQVAAGVADAGSEDARAIGFFLSDKKLYTTTLQKDGVTWSKPQEIPGADIINLRVSYSPLGRLIAYGANPAGNLVTVYQKDGQFVASACDTDGALSTGDFHLCMTDQQQWTIAANVNGKPQIITGNLGASKRGSSAPAPGFNDTLKQVALGYWSGAQNTLVFLMVAGDDALYAWSQAQSNGAAAAQKIPNSKVTQAAGHVSEDGSLHVYAVDSTSGLWALHQHPREPWRDDGTPNWAPMLALDKGVSRIVSDMNPAAEPTLFGLSTGDLSLRLHALDNSSRLWKSHTLLQSSAKAYEVTRFRTEVSLFDSSGQALPYQDVTLKTEKDGSSVDVWAAGQVRTVDAKGVTLQTDATGRLTFAILTSEGLTCPRLVASAKGLPVPITINPAGETHAYLSGNGTLHPTNPGGALPTFDEKGATLAQAKVNGRSLAPGAADSQLAAAAAQAIRNAATVGLGDAKVHGFSGTLLKHAPSFQTFHNEEELQAHRVSLGFANLEAGGIDWKAFIGDIFEGIKNGVIAIAHFVVDVVRKTVDFTLKIAEWTAQALGLPFEGIEKAADFMAGVFNAVDAGIDKVVDWLKALFDFGAIWRTKKALEEGLLSVPDYVTSLAESGRKAADGWFASKKADVDKAFAEMQRKYKDQSFGAQPNWQQPGAPSTSPQFGGASTSDFTNNAHHNWLQDKLSSYAPEESGIPDSKLPKDAWEAFAVHMQNAGSEFQGAVMKFADAIGDTIKDPASFAQIAVPKLLESVRLLIDSALDLCDGVVDLLMAMVESVMQAIKTLLDTELHLGFINTLWEWLAEAAGYPEDKKLTAAGMISLAAAFPCTVIYKLIEGVEHEPFPNGKLPLRPKAGLLGVDMPKPCRMISAILRMVQAVPASIGDFLGAGSPWWLSLIGLGFTAAIWVLANGYPELSGLNWAILSAAAANMLWILPAVYFSLSAATITKAKGVKDDVIAGAFTLLGVITLVFGIIEDATKPDLHIGVALANILLPLSSLFAFLGLTPIRNSPFGPFAIAGQVFFDIVGYVGGGAETLLAVMASKAVAAVEGV